MHSFRELETAAYCPRKLYYRRRSDEEPTVPARVQRRRDLAFEYGQLLSGEGSLTEAPIAVTPTQFRSRLGCVRARFDPGLWRELLEPSGRAVLLTGKDCRGVAHKILEAGEPMPSLVFTGEPPEQGVWTPQSVRLVAAAKALAWERERPIERAIAEYPAHGVVRSISVDARRSAAYREALRIAASIDGPPGRTDNRAKCEPCEFSGRCGVRTRSLRTLLGG